MCKNGKLANFETGPHVGHSRLSHKSLKVKNDVLRFYACREFNLVFKRRNTILYFGATPNQTGISDPSTMAIIHNNTPKVDRKHQDRPTS